MAPDHPRLRGRDIVCIGFADWDTELWTNQHHLMARLAHENRVLFVESLGLRRPQLAGRDLTRIARRLRRGLAPARAADGLHVLSPLVLPFHGQAAARALNRRLLPLLVRRAARRLGMRRPILWAYVPQAEVLLQTLDPEIVIYHCVDDIAAQSGIDGASFRAAERRFATRADLVLASAPALATRMRSLSDNVLYAPNVADTDLFARALAPGASDPAVAELPSPRVLFTGALVARSSTCRCWPHSRGRGRSGPSCSWDRLVRANRAPTSRCSRRSSTSICSDRDATSSCLRCCGRPTRA